MFIGGNDVRAARDADSYRESTALLRAALDGVQTNIQKLVAAGAKRLMVVNVPDIGGIPETRLLAEATGNRFFPTKATTKTAAFNLGLKQRVRSIERDSHLDIVTVDLFGAFRSFLKDSEAYGFTNTTEPCFSQATQSFTTGCNFGQNVYKYAFFDEIHPTAKTHQRAGKVLFSYAPE